MTNNTSLPCDIVQDLLPSYVDGILSDTSTCAVAKHLQSCKTCHDMYDDMVTDELRQDNTDQQEKEIDYLKKVRSKTRHFTLAAILIAVLLAASGTAMILYSIGRFSLEFFRGDLERGNVGTFSTSQFISIFTLAAGIILLVIRSKAKGITEKSGNQEEISE